MKTPRAPRFTFLIASALIASCGGGASDEPNENTGGDNNNATIATPTPAPSLPPAPVSTPTPQPTVPSEPTPSPTPVPVIAPTPTPQLSGALEVLDCGEPQGTIVNNRLDNTAKEYILCKHNEGRSEVALGVYMGANGLLPVATNMQRLKWDADLEQVAQNYADNCEWGHNPNRRDEYNLLSPTDAAGSPISSVVSVGENIAFRSSSRFTAADIDSTWWGYDAWEDEGFDWGFGTINGTEACNVPQCGHFTQIIWATTYKVGCAVSYCQAGLPGFTDFPATYLVCNYASAGNFIGREPYQTSSDTNDVCTNSVSGQTSCANGLTSLPNYDDGL